MTRLLTFSFSNKNSELMASRALVRLRHGLSAWHWNLVALVLATQLVNSARVTDNYVIGFEFQCGIEFHLLIELEPKELHTMVKC